MPLVLKTLRIFFQAKTLNRIIAYIHLFPLAPNPHTHTAMRYACGSSGSRASPPSWDPPLASFDG